MCSIIFACLFQGYQMDVKQFREAIVRPTLEYLEPEIPYSLAAENLIVGTFVHESGGLKYIRQLGGGPAKGFGQMEEATELDNWNNYLRYKPDLKKKIEKLCGVRHLDLIGNIPYQVAMARIKYWRSPTALPKADDIMGLAMTWKAVYNSELGKGTVDQFIAHYPEES